MASERIELMAKRVELLDACGKGYALLRATRRAEHNQIKLRELLPSLTECVDKIRKILDEFESRARARSQEEYFYGVVGWRRCAAARTESPAAKLNVDSYRYLQRILLKRKELIERKIGIVTSEIVAGAPNNGDDWDSNFEEGHDYDYYCKYYGDTDSIADSYRADQHHSGSGYETV